MYKPMNDEVKALWLSALLSKTYKQTTGELQATENGKTGYCCLGVLCDISPIVGTWKPGESDDGKTWFSFGGHSEFPPDSVLGWAGLDQEVTDTLASMNDGGDSFNKIAIWIDKNL